MDEHREVQRGCDTGVAWCTLSVGDEMLLLVDEVRSNECCVRVALGMGDAERQLRAIVVDGVDAAQALAQDSTLSTQEFFEQCFSLTGAPWNQARRRRDMRELIRVHRALEQGVETPCDSRGLLNLWSRATAGEVAWYSECERPQFRTRGVPFGHGKEPFQDAPPPAGCETVAADDIPHEVDALLAFMRRRDLPVEVRAGAAHFLFGHIHPFRDGNGHTARLLACLLLESEYSEMTLLALVRRLQLERATMAGAMADTVRAQSDLHDVVRLFLELLRDSQRDVLLDLEHTVVFP